MAKIHDWKKLLTAADMMNNKVVPFFNEQNVPLLRILTDGKTEVYDATEHHKYDLY